MTDADAIGTEMHLMVRERCDTCDWECSAGAPGVSVSESSDESKVEMQPDLGRRLTAEVFSTFCLVFGGPGAAVIAKAVGSGYGIGGVATASGLAVAVMIFCVGHISGAHMNPAVTIAFAAGRHFPVRDVVPYCIAQLVGAVLASVALRGVFGASLDAAVTHPHFVGQISALWLEIGLTAVLMTVVLAVATDTRAVGALAAVAIGAVVIINVLILGPVTGASMNPARSFGPALVAGDWRNFWIYVVGPIVGALVAVGLYGYLRGGASARPSGLDDAVPHPDAMP